MATEVEKKIGEFTVRIDRDSCIGSANCVNVAADLFAMDDQGIVEFAPGAKDTESEAVLEGCRVCPVEALFVTGPDGKQLVP